MSWRERLAVRPAQDLIPRRSRRWRRSHNRRRRAMFQPSSRSRPSRMMAQQRSGNRLEWRRFVSSISSCTVTDTPWGATAQSLLVGAEVENIRSAFGGLSRGEGGGSCGCCAGREGGCSNEFPAGIGAVDHDGSNFGKGGVIRQVTRGAGQGVRMSLVQKQRKALNTRNSGN